jgi:type IV pilus assembly protein PilP
MKNMKILVIATLLLFLISCKKDMSDLDKYFADAKLTPAKQIEPLPEINSPEIFMYEAEELRDPFSNDLQISTEQNIESAIVVEGAGPDLNRRKEILENFPLDSLFMVGTYSQENDYWGLVEDPEGVIHRVSITEHIGQNYGEIVAINEDQIGVSEWVSDGLGGWTKREARMALREE